jgi:hypothetical protein
MILHIDTWGDTKLYSAETQYIAMLQRIRCDNVLNQHLRQPPLEVCVIWRDIMLNKKGIYAFIRPMGLRKNGKY